MMTRHKPVPYKGVTYRHDRGAHTHLGRAPLHFAHSVMRGKKFGDLPRDPSLTLPLHWRITLRGISLEIHAADNAMRYAKGTLIAYFMAGNVQPAAFTLHTNQKRPYGTRP